MNIITITHVISKHKLQTVLIYGRYRGGGSSGERRGEGGGLVRHILIIMTISNILLIVHKRKREMEVRGEKIEQRRTLRGGRGGSCTFMKGNGVKLFREGGVGWAGVAAGRVVGGRG